MEHSKTRYWTNELNWKLHAKKRLQQRSVPSDRVSFCHFTIVVELLEDKTRRQASTQAWARQWRVGRSDRGDQLARPLWDEEERSTYYYCSVASMVSPINCSVAYILQCRLYTAVPPIRDTTTRVASPLTIGCSDVIDNERWRRCIEGKARIMMLLQLGGGWGM